VIAQGVHPTTGMLSTYTSEPIWLDLTAELAGQNMTVLIDPARPKQHYVDLSEWVTDDQLA